MALSNQKTEDYGQTLRSKQRKASRNNILNADSLKDLGKAQAYEALVQAYQSLSFGAYVDLVFSEIDLLKLEPTFEDDLDRLEAFREVFEVEGQVLAQLLKE